MRKQRDERLGQIGDYWLSKKPGREGSDDAWCRTWYDEQKRQTCRVSLGTADLSKASVLLAEWVVANQRIRKATPDQVLIETVLLHYWNDHAQHLPSAKTQWLRLSYWQEFWTRSTVADITPQEQRRFRDWLAKRGTGQSGIDRILSVGRAALNRARKWEEVSDVPHIFGPLTAEAKRAREPKGRPVTPEEIARLMDASRLLGHLPDGSAATTSIYAPYEPGFLGEAVEAIEAVMVDVRKHLKRAQIDNPDIDPADLPEHAAKRTTVVSESENTRRFASSFSRASRMRKSSG